MSTSFQSTTRRFDDESAAGLDASPQNLPQPAAALAYAGALPLILAAALPLLIALLAALPPARKAGRADPLSLLRDAT